MELWAVDLPVDDDPRAPADEALHAVLVDGLDGLRWAVEREPGRRCAAGDIHGRGLVGVYLNIPGNEAIRFVRQAGKQRLGTAGQRGEFQRLTAAVGMA